MTGSNIKQQDLNKKGILSIDGDLMRLVLIMIACFTIMAILKPDAFLTIDNFSSISFQIPEFGILAIGMMLSMISGGIDLSMVGIANFSGVVASFMMVKSITPESSETSILYIIALAILISIAIGFACGNINGFLITRIGIPPILATLGTMQLFTGAAIAVTGGATVVGLPESFSNIGNQSIGIIPIPLIIFIAVAILVSTLLSKTSFGIKLLMMGTNPTASKYSGINNNKVLMNTYILSGVLASLAGIIMASRTNSANAVYGVSYTLQAILLCVLGGVNPNGGFGKVIGLIVAVLTLQFLSSGFNMLEFSSFLKDFVWGAVLIIVLIVNYFSNKSKYNF